MLASEQEHYKCYSPEDEIERLSPEATASDAIPDTVTIESGVRASKTALLLLGTLLEQQQSPTESHRITSASVSSQHQSVMESDKLLRNWTNQHDPLAWDDDGSDDESLLPSDSVSKYHGRSHCEPIGRNISTFFESATSISELGGAEVSSESTISVEERLDLSLTCSAEDAADRSRQKVAKLTGVDYTAITADW
jgi:hypothetical protein